MKDITKKYSNGEVTIVWKPTVCAHSTICWKGNAGLSSVFNPSKKPWIDPLGASTERIVEQVDKCPSGALSYFFNNEEEQKTQEAANATKVDVSENGPLLVHGDLTIKHKDGTEEQRQKVTAFCRCGQSNNKPYCDGSHRHSGFQG